MTSLTLQGECGTIKKKTARWISGKFWLIAYDCLIQTYSEDRDVQGKSHPG